MFDEAFLPLLLAAQATRIGMEAQTVIAMRLAGMAGLWDSPPDEMHRMVAEKAVAVVEAGNAATQATLSGMSPARAMQAGMSTIGRYTSGNVQRLGDRGPTWSLWPL